MVTTSNDIHVLNNLIELNNDRIAGFEKAVADIKDENIDLKELFLKFAAQSRKNTQELTALVATSGGEVETGNTAAGTLHRVWIDIKSLFGGTDRGSILSEAERGEDAIKKAYQDASVDNDISAKVLELVRSQAVEINAAHDAIKALRDASK
ncbi:PA2169 family four-helix-bundle protein [Chitinophaga sp.]|uniref:PA2169 family four-helix-bundle protein n=1 Tax=Chitinophaga sp. TaxID=1869181 RepID=UPI0031D446C7